MNRRLRYNEGIWQYLGVLTHGGRMRGNLLVSEPERSENRRRNDGTCNGWNPAFCGERLDDGGEGTGTGRLFSAGRGRGILPGTDQTGDQPWLQ